MNEPDTMTAMWHQFLGFLVVHGAKLEDLSREEVIALYEQYKRETRS